MTTRRLYLVPIIHAEADLGSMVGAVRQAVIRTAGPDGWQRRQEQIRRFWSRVRAWAEESLPASLDGWSVYQDGLPVCGRELEIVLDLAQKGSENHRVLRGLVRRGATLVGTESPALLVEELNLVRDTIARANGGGPDDALAARSRDLLLRRDRFIADRIGRTLTAPDRAGTYPDEGLADAASLGASRAGSGTGIGILFVGALHNVGAALPPDIQVEIIRPDPGIIPAGAA